MELVQHKAVKAALKATDDALGRLFSAKKNLEASLEPRARKINAEGQRLTLPPASFSKLEHDPRKLDFEGLPAEMRLKVYRELLVSPAEIDPVYGRDAIRVYPAILRVSRKIHNEASVVLYGENMFASSIYRGHVCKLWHRLLSKKTLIPRSSSCKISQIHLYVNTSGTNMYSPTTAGLVTINAGLAAKKLSLNNLKVLKVTCFQRQIPDTSLGNTNSVGYIRYDALQEFEICMEPLKLIRAAKFTITGNCSVAMARDMKSAIEGDRDQVLSAQAKMVESEDESDLEEQAFGLDDTIDSDDDYTSIEDDGGLTDSEDDGDWRAQICDLDEFSDGEDKDEHPDVEDANLVEIYGADLHPTQP